MGVMSRLLKDHILLLGQDVDGEIARLLQLANDDHTSPMMTPKRILRSIYVQLSRRLSVGGPSLRATLFFVILNIFQFL